MRVLVAREFSGTVRDAFNERVVPSAVSFERFTDRHIFRNMYQRRNSMTDLNTAALIENERRVEARIARHERMHRELIDEIMDEVIDEIDAGQHDDELANSHLIDTTNAMAVARHVARDHERGPFKPEPDARAIWDLTMQIRDYAKDVAERRILRRMDDDL